MSKIGKHATTVGHDPNGITVTYHSTAIVRADSGSISLNFGHIDYVTKTTILKMNQTSEEFDLGFRVFRDKKTVYVEFMGKRLLFRGPKDFTTAITLSRESGNITSIGGNCPDGQQLRASDSAE